LDTVIRPGKNGGRPGCAGPDSGRPHPGAGALHLRGLRGFGQLAAGNKERGNSKIA